MSMYKLSIISAGLTALLCLGTAQAKTSSSDAAGQAAPASDPAADAKGVSPHGYFENMSPKADRGANAKGHYENMSPKAGSSASPRGYFENMSPRQPLTNGRHTPVGEARPANGLAQGTDDEHEGHHDHGGGKDDKGGGKGVQQLPASQPSAVLQGQQQQTAPQ